MRLIMCLISLLWGCSTPAVRCDAHLQPINPPAASGTPGPAVKRAAQEKTP